MKKLTTLLLTGTIATIGAYSMTASAHDEDSKGQITEIFNDLKGYEAISVLGVYDLDVEVGGKFGVSLSGDKDEMDNVKVYVKDGTLYLGKKDEEKSKKRKHTEGIEATVTLPAMNGLRVTGVANGEVSGVDAKDFEVTVTGIANVEVEGMCQSLEVKLSGMGDVDASDLECKHADATLSGVGSMSVFASKSVEVSASGIGEVNVYGEPKKIEKNKGMLTKVNLK